MQQMDDIGSNAETNRYYVRRVKLAKNGGAMYPQDSGKFYISGVVEPFNNRNDMKRYLFAVALCLCSYGLAAAAEKGVEEAPMGDVNITDSVTLMTNPTATTGKEILAEIASEFKGRPAFIDFWATWCGPCMRAMTSIDPIKEEYYKDVAFVYITGETSPEEDFNNAIPKIKGYHYRLSGDQYKALLGEYGIRGIPSYMLLDEDGKQVYDNIETGGYPGDEVVRAQLDAVTK